MLATSGIVVLVAFTVGRFGPLVGGVIAGLPIGLGPGFYFLLEDASAEFLAQAATSSLLALGATQVFLATYISLANRLLPVVAVGVASLVWAVSATALSRLEPGTITAAVIFAALTFAAYQFGKRFQFSEVRQKAKEGLGLLALRASLAGLLVAGVTSAAQLLGAAMTGVLLAFPIGYALIAFTIHKRFGTANVVAMLHSTIIGTLGLASFCVGLSLALERFSNGTALVVGLLVSLATTVLLVLRSLWSKP